MGNHVTLLAEDRKRQRPLHTPLIPLTTARDQKQRNTFPGQTSVKEVSQPLQSLSSDGSIVQSIDVRTSKLRKHRTHPTLPRGTVQEINTAASLSPGAPTHSSTDRITEDDFLTELTVRRPITKRYKLKRKEQSAHFDSLEEPQLPVQSIPTPRVPVAAQFAATPRSVRPKIKTSYRSAVELLSPLTARLPSKQVPESPAVPEITMRRAESHHRSSIFSLAPLRIPDRAGDKSKTLHYVAEASKGKTNLQIATSGGSWRRDLLE